MIKINVDPDFWNLLAHVSPDLIEMNLPEWTGRLTDERAVDFIATMRSFLDKVEEAMKLENKDESATDIHIPAKPVLPVEPQQTEEEFEKFVVDAFGPQTPIDPGYYAYVRRFLDLSSADLDQMDYKQWLEATTRWNELDQQFKTEFPDQFQKLTPEQEKRANGLIKEMSDLEYFLAH
jgi:hypothetical protein